MPLYEYRCTSCNTEYEELVSSSDTTTPPCPNCNSTETEKKFSVFGSAGGSCGGSSGFT
jgi:putative FmdB family regulatory protein